jgi:hypothetical protein
VFSNKSQYCHTCSHFAYRMQNEQFPPEIIKSLWDYIRKNGYRCYYTGMLLEMEDDTSPWYCDFDHWVPGDSRKVVITSALLNAMKTDLSVKEFRYYVLQLDDHRKKHLKVRKRKLVYWNRLVPFSDKRCPICGRPKLRHHEYCPRCAKFGHRMKAKFPKEASRAIWDYVRKNGYVCYYTGMRLDMDNPKSPWYCVFDHWMPHDPRKVVLTSFLVNDMKSDLTEKEFWYIIGQLANYIRKGTKVRKRKLIFWKRPYKKWDT